MITRKNKTAIFTLLILLAGFIIPAYGYLEDDYSAEADARVARIRYVDGVVEVKRIDSEDWEEAALNLPLVEGDEVRTFAGARVEIQFDNETYLRLDETSIMKIVSLGDEGAAVSISQGTLLFSVFKYDPASYLEIDAPGSTVTLTKEGKYRVDAGDDVNKTVKVSVWDGGTARVYTLDSGFTLKNEQSAMMNLEGEYAGEWEISRSDRISDYFEDWVADRDVQINENLKDAYYGRYYDSDLYGADDLNYYGSWQYSNDYGYIWSPYDRAVSSYDNWSPYRYGQWRWLPYYGWTWVNDEPWGWATYHYGRWIYLNGRWYWTPYSYSGYYPNRRSWWRPAIVYIDYIGNRVCWYPLPYNYAYYDYNRRYRNHWRDHRRDRNNTNPQTNTPPAPDPANVARAARNSTPPLQRVPPGGVVTTSKIDFGTKRGKVDTAPPEISKEILSKKPVAGNTPPILPDMKDFPVQKKPRIIPTERKEISADRKIPIGAGDRKVGEPLDKKLLREKMRANRPPLITMPRVDQTNERKIEKPPIGVFDRTRPSPNVERRSTEPQTDTKRSTTPPLIVTPKKTEPVERKTPMPVYRPTPKPVERKPAPPVYRPAPKQEERKPSPPVYVPPQRKVEQPRPSPPVTRRPQPKIENRPPSPPRTKSPPPSNNTKRESKPAPKPPVTVKKPDN